MRGQCIGHFDYFGSYLVWTRHFLGTTAFKVIPYDHCAPECVDARYD